MKRILLGAILLFSMNVSSAFALPMTQTFAQLSVEPFNFVEGFILSGQRFSAASPSDGINYSGIGNFTNPNWHGDMPNNSYVRAWGPSENFLFWDAVLDGSTYNGLPMSTTILWFFYNTPTLAAPPQGQLNLLTFQTNYNPYAPEGLKWTMASSIYQNNFGPIPNMYSDEMAGLSSDILAPLRGEWTVPVDPSAPVPEPSTVVLLAAGIGLVAVMRRQRLFS
ncbi:PEP-CTERM motif protein [Geobacter sp. OR-1]|uniref:PEP-CTERM sorting domain-containing protein n=1 Tax=Geobacter sp. OR-1 TaxID=1266765 RepID=UPI0005435D1D|nr:PEP-CTERM sorting domain-containing protein [Geobacter sp. OR-1]GAM08813.1 PEP-CTERM motif protein [Geobacter sp. OR-1]